MAYLESEAAKVIDKFHGEKFSLWKFKMGMALASVDLWDIVDGSQSVEGIPNLCEKIHVHHCAQFGTQPICTH